MLKFLNVHREKIGMKYVVLDIRIQFENENQFYLLLFNVILFFWTGCSKDKDITNENEAELNVNNPFQH